MLCSLIKHEHVAVKVAVGKNLVAMEGPQAAVVCSGGGSEGLLGLSNTALTSWKREKRGEVELVLFGTHVS
jgi:hypothetical protein